MIEVVKNSHFFLLIQNSFIEQNRVSHSNGIKYKGTQGRIQDFRKGGGPGNCVLKRGVFARTVFFPSL